MTKSILLLIFVTFFIESCENKPPKVNLDSTISEILHKEAVISSDVMMILYLKEGMCSECINKELMNLKTIANSAEHIIIIGNYSNNRIFMSNVANIDVMKIYLPDNLLCNDEVCDYPFYLIYDGHNNRVLEIYKPTDCNNVETLNFYNRFITKKY